MEIRECTPLEYEQLAELFRQTVRTVSPRDYSPRQLEAWISGSLDLCRWNASFEGHYVLIALENGAAVGFGDIDPAAGYLDRLYVSSQYQRRGIATMLCDRLEAKVPDGAITVHASITAKPFFEQRGYQVQKPQQVIRQGIALTNYLMIRRPDTAQTQ